MKIQKQKINDKIINCLGDSTTWGDNGLETGGNEISWTKHIQDQLPFKKVRNYGIRASRIAMTPNRNDSFLERYKQMDNEADIITVLGGINDFQHNVPIGKFTVADPTTFLGALNILIHGLVAKYPYQTIIFMTPMKNNFHHPTKKYPTTLQKNDLGNYQEQYAQAIEEICHFYSIPVIDLFNESGISPFLPEYVPKFMPDGMHYSDLGYEKLSKIIAGKLIQFI